MIKCTLLNIWQYHQKYSLFFQLTIYIYDQNVQSTIGYIGPYLSMLVCLPKRPFDMARVFLELGLCAKIEECWSVNEG